MTDYADRSIAIRGLLAAAVAAALNAGVVAAARAATIAPEFEPLAYSPVVFLTVLGAVAATFVLAAVSRLSSNPARTFVRVVAVALVLSFLPDLLLLQAEPTATVAGVLVLAVMHVVAATVVVGFLVRGVAGVV